MKKTISTVLAATLVLGCAATSAGCKAKEKIVRDSVTINVRLYEAGFGFDFLYSLEDKFEALYKEEGYEVNILKSPSSQGDTVIRELYKGYDDSGIDLYITGAITPNRVSEDNEYDKELCEDLRELVFTQSAIEYDGTESAKVSERVHSDIVPYLCADNGKMYGFTWANTTAGMVVNTAKLAACGITEYPRTTNELFEVFETIKAADKGVYPVTYDLGKGEGRAATYQDCAVATWFAQYDIDTYNEFLRMEEKKDGVWTEMDEGWKVFENENLKDVLEVSYQFMDKKYALPGSSSQVLSQAQDAIVDNKGAVFMLNGDWFLNEVKYNFNDDELQDIDFMNVPVISALGVKLFGEGTAYNLGKEACDELLSYVCKLVDENQSIDEIVALVQSEKGIEIAREDVEAVATARGVCFARGIEHLAFITKGSEKKHIAALFLRMMASDSYAETFMEDANGVSPYASSITTESDFTFVNSAKALSLNQHYRAVNSRIQGTRFKVFSSDYLFPAIDNLALHLYDKAASTSYTDAANKLYNDSLNKVQDLWKDYD